jgi:hypothetical protein
MLGRILTNRRYLTINDLLFKVEENGIEYPSDTFYTIGVLANVFEPAKDRVKAMLSSLRVQHAVSQNSKFSKLITVIS